MKIFEGPTGKRVITGTIRDLKFLDEWGRALYKSILPPKDAEERYKQLTIWQLVSLWK